MKLYTNLSVFLLILTASGLRAQDGTAPSVTPATDQIVQAGTEPTLPFTATITGIYDCPKPSVQGACLPWKKAGAPTWQWSMTDSLTSDNGTTNQTLLVDLSSPGSGTVSVVQVQAWMDSSPTSPMIMTTMSPATPPINVDIVQLQFACDGQTDPADFLVRAPLTVPAYTFSEPCTVTSMGTLNKTVRLTLSCDQTGDGDLGFGRTEVALSPSKLTTGFLISGKHQSSTYRDCLIKAVDQNGDQLGQTPATVYWFSGSLIVHANSDAYKINHLLLYAISSVFGTVPVFYFSPELINSKYISDYGQIDPKRCVEMEGYGVVHPKGVATGSNQLKDIQIGMCQNVSTPCSRLKVYDKPSFINENSSLLGQTITIPPTFTLTSVLNAPGGNLLLDAASDATPIYDPDSSLCDLSVEGGPLSDFMTSDCPFMGGPETYEVPIYINYNGSVVKAGDGVYKISSCQFIGHTFTDWLCTYNKETRQIFPILQGAWQCDVNSSGTTPAITITSPGVSPTFAPHIVPPIANDAKPTVTGAFPSSSSGYIPIIIPHFQYIIADSHGFSKTDDSTNKPAAQVKK